MPAPPEITLPERLRWLVKYCEVGCDPECCGINAFEFSPLYVAAYLSAYTGRISSSDIAEWEQELAKAEESVKGLTPNEDGLICSIAEMNQGFTPESFSKFIAELRHSIHVSPQVLELSESLRHATEKA